MAKIRNDDFFVTAFLPGGVTKSFCVNAIDLDDAEVMVRIQLNNLGISYDAIVARQVPTLFD